MSFVRDIMGRSPLYYYDGSDGRIYGSSLRELFAKGVPRKLLREGLRSYLEYGCVYEPLTIIDGVYAVWPETVEGWGLRVERLRVGG